MNRGLRETRDLPTGTPSPTSPPGFKDGVDNGTFASNIVESGNLAADASWVQFDVGPYSPNADVDFSVIPPVNGRVSSRVVNVWRNASGVWYRDEVANTNMVAVSYKVRARVQSEGIAAAGLKQQLKNVKVTNKKVKRSE